MRTYDLVLVLKTTLSEAQRKKLLDSVKTWLKSVKIEKEADWGQKVLSYSIKHQPAGYYVAYSLSTEESVPADFEKRLITNEEVLRHLLVRTK